MTIEELAKQMSELAKQTKEGFDEVKQAFQGLHNRVDELEKHIDEGLDTVTWDISAVMSNQLRGVRRKINEHEERLGKLDHQAGQRLRP